MSELRRNQLARPTTMLTLGIMLVGSLLASQVWGANDFSWSPTTPNIGQATRFTSTFAASTSKVRWTFDAQGCSATADPKVIEIMCLFDGCPATFHFASAGAHSVNLAFETSPGSGTFTSVATHQVTVNNSGTCATNVPPSAPVLTAPADGQQLDPGQVTFSWQASSGSAPISYVVKYCSLTLCTTSTTSCSATLATPGTCEWYVIASNTSGSAESQHRTVTIRSACAATAVPTANFSWTPNAPTTIGGVTQAQPYEGQEVQLNDLSTNTPTAWDWTDFSAPTPWPHLTQQNPTYTWTTPGSKVVRLTATNCKGPSVQASQTIVVAADVRPVIAQFTVAPEIPMTGQPVTFTADNTDENGEPNRFTWDFGDGSAPVTTTTLTTSHIFDCARTYSVSLVAARQKSTLVTSTKTTVDLIVSGTSCAPRELLVLDVARNAPGVGSSVWNTDVKMFNPTTEDMILKLRYKMTGTSAANESPSFLLHAGGVRTLESVLAELAPHWPTYLDFTKACIWMYQADPDDRGVLPLPLMSARTHTGAAPGYDDYGMMLPVLSVVAPSSVAQVYYLLGAEHNGKTAQTQLRGFRTNMSVVDPNGTGFAPGKVKLTLLRPADPSFKKTKDLWGFPVYGYEARSIIKYFDGIADDDDLGVIVVKLEIAPNTAVAIGASLVTNSTNDPATIEPTPAD